MRVESVSGSRIKVRFAVPSYRQRNALRTVSSHSTEMQPGENVPNGASAAEIMRKSNENPDQPPTWFTKYMEQFSSDLRKEISIQVVSQVTDLLFNINLCDMSKTHSQLLTAVQSEATDVVHVGVICDHCKELVRGVRYKCGNCVDYNLCSKCELRSGVHSEDHVFLKIRNPACSKCELRGHTGHRCKDVPLLKHRVYKRGHAHLNSPSAGSSKHGSSACFQSKRERKIKKTLKKLEKYSSSISDFVIPNDVSSSEATASQNNSNTNQELLYKEPNAQFIRDESSPDGACVAPGTTFTKCWRIKNTGSTMWLCDTMLKNYWGSPGLTPHKTEIVVPPLLPGEEGTIMVLFTAPQQPGCYQSLWRLHHKSRDFGDDIWCKTEVKAPADANAYSRAPTLKLDATKKIQDGYGEKDAINLEQEKGQKLSPLAPATPNNTPFDLTPPKSPEPKDIEPNFNLAGSGKDIETNYSSDATDSDSTASILSISSSSDYDGDYVKIPISVPCSMFDFCSTPPVQDASSEKISEATASPGSKGEPLNLSCKSVKSVSQETGEENTTSTEMPAKTAATLPQSLQTLSATALQYAPAKSLVRENSATASQEMPSVPLVDTRVPYAAPNRAPSHRVPVVPVVSRNPFLVCNEPQPETTNLPEGPPNYEAVTEQPSNTMQRVPEEIPQYVPSTTADDMVIQVLPDGLVNGVLTATASVYNTARAIWTTVQQREMAVPPQPPAPTPEISNAMDQLIEMGFCDRALNRELLLKHKDDVTAVVGELITIADNNWHANRHNRARKIV